MGAKNTIVVAFNKIDKVALEDRPAKRAEALTKLLEIGIVAEEFGGDVGVVEFSAKTGEGVDGLVESLILRSDIMELKSCETG